MFIHNSYIIPAHTRILKGKGSRRMAEGISRVLRIWNLNHLGANTDVPNVSMGRRSTGLKLAALFPLLWRRRPPSARSLHKFQLPFSWVFKYMSSIRPCMKGDFGSFPSPSVTTSGVWALPARGAFWSWLLRTTYQSLCKSRGNLKPGEEWDSGWHSINPKNYDKPSVALHLLALWNINSAGCLTFFFVFLLFPIPPFRKTGQRNTPTLICKGWQTQPIHDHIFIDSQCNSAYYF